VRKIAVEADTGAHADDEVAEEEGDHFNNVNGMGVEPEEAGHGPDVGNADEEGIFDFLFESGPPGDNASWGCGRYWLGKWGDRHLARSIFL
jgi:hypothetical protein